MENYLKVTPLKKYKIPKYPAFDGEDPLSPRKKKLSKNGYYIAALMGVVGLFSFESTSQKPKFDSPIKFKELGFPHTYASFGTGLPARLNREKAVAIIDSVFQSNGIDLIKDYQVSEGENEFKATGFNPDSKIGYVWLDNKNTAQDCYRTWGGIQYPENRLLENDRLKLKQIRETSLENEVREQTEAFFERLGTKNYYKLINLERHLYGDDEREKEIKEYLIKNKDWSRADYGQEILDKYEQAVLNLKEVETIVDMEEPTIGAFSVYSSLAAYPNYFWGGSEKANSYREEAIERLACFVQDYIDWAKYEGRF